MDMTQGVEATEGNLNVDSSAGGGMDITQGIDAMEGNRNVDNTAGGRMHATQSVETAEESMNADGAKGGGMDTTQGIDAAEGNLNADGAESSGMHPTRGIDTAKANLNAAGDAAGRMHAADSIKNAQAGMAGETSWEETFLEGEAPAEVLPEEEDGGSGSVEAAVAAAPSQAYNGEGGDHSFREGADPPPDTARGGHRRDVERNGRGGAARRTVLGMARGFLSAWAGGRSRGGGGPAGPEASVSNAEGIERQ